MPLPILLWNRALGAPAAAWRHVALLSCCASGSWCAAGAPLSAAVAAAEVLTAAMPLPMP
jgi:hypothetical protein